jgi:hypothetical protein
LETERSACGFSVSLSVALLLPATGSVVPPGAVTVAVLLRVPVAPEAIVALTVKVAVPPTSSVTLLLMLPLPLAGQLDPAEALQVQATPVRLAGKVSPTVAPVATLGPLLVTVTV